MRFLPLAFLSLFLLVGNLHAGNLESGFYKSDNIRWTAGKRDYQVKLFRWVDGSYILDGFTEAQSKRELTNVKLAADPNKAGSYLFETTLLDEGSSWCSFDYKVRLFPSANDNEFYIEEYLPRTIRYYNSGGKQHCDPEGYDWEPQTQPYQRTIAAYYIFKDAGPTDPGTEAILDIYFPEKSAVYVDGAQQTLTEGQTSMRLVWGPTEWKVSPMEILVKIPRDEGGESIRKLNVKFERGKRLTLQLVYGYGAK